MSTLAPGLFQILVELVNRFGQILQALIQSAEVVEVALAFQQCLFLPTYAFKQFIELHRLLVVIGKAFAQRADHVLFLGTPGQHDGFEHALATVDLLQGAHQFDAVPFRHVQVTDEQTDGRVCHIALDGFVS
ncbi:hypothetical protein D3C79_753330 [compost metagenome]